MSESKLDIYVDENSNMIYLTLLQKELSQLEAKLKELSNNQSYRYDLESRVNMAESCIVGRMRLTILELLSEYRS